MTATGRLDLPDGRATVIAAELAGVVRCGVLAVDGVAVGDAPDLAAEMSVRAVELRRLYRDLSPGDIPALGEARRLYRAAGVDPTRTRPSSEALLRRVLREQPLPRVNAAVDAINLASLFFLLPIGLYDLDRVRGDVELRRGRAGEAYPGIRKGEIHLEGRLGLFDAQRPVRLADQRLPADERRRDDAAAAGDRVRHVGVSIGPRWPVTSICWPVLSTAHCGGRVVCAGFLSRTG